MKIIIKILPHITFILSIMFVTFLILDKFNPVMQFVGNDISIVLLFIFAFATLFESIYLIVINTKEGKKKEKKKRKKKDEEDIEELLKEE